MICSGFILFDIEAPSFRPDYLHCIVITDLIKRTRESYVGLDRIAEAINRILEAKMVSGHYIKGFDLKVIFDLVGEKYPDNRAIDTLQLSRRYCQLPKHGLAYWGELVGLPKLKQPDFEVLTPYMVEYCERDVDLNVVVFDVLVDIILERGGIPQEYAILNEYISERDKTQILIENA